MNVGGKELLLMTEKDGGSCLYVACDKGHLEVVNVLIEAGRKELLLMTQNSGCSCLYAECHEGHLEVGGPPGS